MKHWRILLISALCLGCAGMALGQRTITGAVTDAETGEPLIGANVLIVGTSSGTVTDFDGNYELEV
ncbi:MAG: carboxypeptidase-like regulatory domain-containing protein, partial [Phaeodactylibacter sp.]|nr:carboxypeptidase-like regulatory domain-containing protein [Phaeodactylibacter sp.]